MMRRCRLCGTLYSHFEGHECVSHTDVANKPANVANNVANAALSMANTEPDVANTATPSTYRYRDKAARRAYQRDYMRRKRAGQPCEA
jgi:hypothetical protein